jgi:hypothetical protein
MAVVFCVYFSKYYMRTPAAWRVGKEEQVAVLWQRLEWKVIVGNITKVVEALGVRGNVADRFLMNVD